MIGDVSAALLALGLPWLCGAIWVRLLLQSAGGMGAAGVIGWGYFIGVFISSVILQCWDLLGFELSLARNLGVVVLLGGVGLLCQWLMRRPPVPPLAQPAAPRWHVVVAILLLAMLGGRYATMLVELLHRPLYAWDGWMNWAPKPVVWLQLEYLVPFVDPASWLQQQGEGVYTLGNRAASEYPLLVPLIQLWTMLALGSWDSSLVYLPWLLAPLALGLVFYGHLRLAGMPVLWSVVACYCLLSMPYLNVHSVLAGYADHWLAAAFSLGICALYQWHRVRTYGWLLLWVISAVMCAQLKNPGLVLAAIIVLSGTLGMVCPNPRTATLLASLCVGAALVIIFVGFRVHLPLLGEVDIAGARIYLEYFGIDEQMELHPSGQYFARSFFVMTNWHLLFYLLPAVLVFALLRNWLRFGLPPYLMATLGGCVFIWVVFSLTNHFHAAENFHTLNRALLYIVPALLFCAALQCRALLPTATDGGVRP